MSALVTALVVGGTVLGCASPVGVGSLAALSVDLPSDFGGVPTPASGPGVLPLRPDALRPAANLGSGLVRVPDAASAWVDANPSDPRADPIRRAIVSQPNALWLTGPSSSQNLANAVQLTNERQGALTLVLYNIPARDDGLSGPNFGVTGADYRAWIDSVSAQLGATRAVVVVEPDALWFVDRQTPGGAAYDERIGSLRYAVDTLAQRNPGASVYLEAGTTSGSVSPERMAQLLAAADVAHATGFAVNVSSFAPDPEITAYAQAIRTSLIATQGIGNPRYVVDTGRNGNPVWDYEWCNPPGRRLGSTPGPRAGVAGLDLDLWVKGPGTSDGNCGIGAGTSGGQFMPDVAISMIGG